MAETKTNQETIRVEQQSIENEKSESTKITIKDLIEKAKVQYAWYVDLYPTDMRGEVARELLRLEANGAVGCSVCGIPSGMRGLTFRSIKRKTPEGKTIKQYMCYHCISEELNRINAQLEESNKIKA